jgi:hypothetical protein
MKARRKVVPYFKTTQAEMQALLPLMPVRVGVLVLLSGRQNYRNKSITLSEIQTSLSCPVNTLLKALGELQREGTITVNGALVSRVATYEPSVGERPFSRKVEKPTKQATKPSTAPSTESCTASSTTSCTTETEGNNTVLDAFVAPPDVVDLSDLFEEGENNPPSPLTKDQAVIPFKSEPVASPAPASAAPVQAPVAKRRRSSKGSAPAADFPQPSERLASIPGFLERWADWQVALEERRAPMKPTTAKHQLRLLEAASDPVAMLDYSLNNQRYTALYADRGTGRQQNPSGRGGKPATGEDANERLRENFERRRLLLQGGGHAA